MSYQGHKLAIFFAWFKEQITFRTDQLLYAVRSDEDHSSWEIDFSASSLSPLASWYVKNVNTRPRLEAEKESIYSSAPPRFRQVEIDDWDLTDRTFSFAFDVGVYFGEVLSRSTVDVQWHLDTSRPSSAYYHLPILAQEGPQICCPIHLMTVYAYGIARGNKGAGRLRELFQIWQEILSK